MGAGDPSQESELCTSCGLCCEGVLYRSATLLPDEVNHANAQGLSLQLGSPPSFLLPCPLFKGTCTIYADRPGPCRRYVCEVIGDVRAGAITPEEARGRIAAARQRVAEVRAELPSDAKGIGIWRQVEGLAEEQGVQAESSDFLSAHPALVLALAALTRELDASFRERPGAEE